MSEIQRLESNIIQTNYWEKFSNLMRIFKNVSQCRAEVIKIWNTIILLDITLQFNSECENIDLIYVAPH